MIFDSFIKLVIGDLDEKRAYRQMWKRAKALPADYRFVYRKIYHYMMNRGVNAEDLLDLFEAGAAEGRPVLDITGEDVGAFCDDFIRASSGFSEGMRDEINKEILEHFHREGQ